MSPTAQQTRSPSAWRRRAGRTLAAGVVGATVLGTAMFGTAVLGAGAASAAVPTLTCPSGQQLVRTVLGTVCRVVGGTAGGATSAVPKVVAPVRTVVPKVVPNVVEPVRTAVPKVGGGSTGAPASGGSAGSAAGTSRAPASASSAPASAAPAPAPAPIMAPVALAPDTSLVSAFGTMPASLLSGTRVPSAFGSFAALGAAPGTRPYDPGLLLSSAQPLRRLAPSPVTTSSTAQPLALLGDGRIGTPVLLSVLSGAVVLALLVRAAVLRRARARESR